MFVSKRFFVGFWATGVSLALLGQTGTAQSEGTSEAGGWRPIRGQWEERVLQRDFQEAPTRETPVTRPVRSRPTVREDTPSREPPLRTASAPPPRTRTTRNGYSPAVRSPRTAYADRPGAYRTSRSSSMRVAQHERSPMTPEPEVIPPGDIQYEPLGGSYGQPGGCSGDGCSGMDPGCGDCGDYCDCGDCMEDCGEYCPPCFGPFFCWGPRNLAIFAGVQGFKGPRDRGRNGNFGFNEGVNWGAPLGDPWGCGYQLGFAALQSNFSGDQVGLFAPTNPNNTARTADRHQYFFTAGLFRRADPGGLEWGVVFDLLHDTYYDKTDVKQIRTEFGWQLSECCEIGYSGAYRLGSDTIADSFGRDIDGKLDATDQFVGFIRRYFENGGEGRIWGGATGDGDGLLGADCWLPLGRGFALQNSFNYLIPKLFRGNDANPNTGVQTGGQIEESWNLSINLVWYPGKSAQCMSTSCYRPLLPVADNGQFMVKERPVTSGH
ncbi:MAG: hypothetical protein JXB10_19895 [Pirellulales bacterium]|nr:hypothetical protein [Pirellulales bacterium]